MSVLPVETRLVTFLNVVLLILVAITPYLFDQLVSLSNTSDVQNYASILFTFVFAGSLFIMAVFAHIIAQEEKRLVDGEIMVRYRRSRNILTLLTIVVLLSLAAPWDRFFLGVHVRLLIWFVPIVLFWFNRMRRNAPLGGAVTSKPV